MSNNTQKPLTNTEKYEKLVSKEYRDELETRPLNRLNTAQGFIHKALTLRYASEVFRMKDGGWYFYEDGKMFMACHSDESALRWIEEKMKK